MKQLWHIFNIHPDPVFKAAAALSTQIVTVSRVTHKPDLIKIPSLFSIPEVPGTFNKNFETIALEMGQDIWKAHTVDGNVHIFWSGGIDSTVAIVALLMTAPPKGKVITHFNLSSIFENIDFYKILLKDPRIEFRNASHLDKTRFITYITGELGDQIFGSELLFRIAREFGFEKLSEPFEKIVPRLFNSRCGSDILGQAYYKRFLPIIEDCPFQIKTAFDYIWWWNFTQKWQGVKLRKQCFIQHSHKLIHFFDSDDFQRWSIASHSLKIGETIESYKKPAKDMIYKFDKNSAYRDVKRKTSSPFVGKLYSYGFFEDGTQISNWSECYQILQDYKMIDTENFF